MKGPAFNKVKLDLVIVIHYLYISNVIPAQTLISNNFIHYLSYLYARLSCYPPDKLRLFFPTSVFVWIILYSLRQIPFLIYQTTNFLLPNPNQGTYIMDVSHTSPAHHPPEQSQPSHSSSLLWELSHLVTFQLMICVCLSPLMACKALGVELMSNLCCIHLYTTEYIITVHYSNPVGTQ